jgi:hypothetical protein
MTTSPVSMADAIRNAILYQLNGIHTTMPGQIISYDFTTQKASVQPTINKVWTDETISQMPVLENVPVIFPESGGASITFPVVVGDTCLILVCERSITEWLLNGGIQSPNDPRKLDLTDAVAIMGLKPFNAVFPPRTNNTDLVINFAGSTITITNTGAIKIDTATSIALGTPAVELINQLFTVFTALMADPALWALLTTAKPAIINFITNMSPYPVGIGGTLP